MENMPLIIPPNKKVKGLVVYCYKCKTNITSGICKTTGRSIKQCQNGDKHKFKIYISVPGTKNERRTKTLETRDIYEAMKQAIDFEREVKESANQPKQIKREIQQEIEKCNKNQNRPQLLVHALARYIGFLNNEGVPEHLIKERSTEHIKDVERAFKSFAESLSSSGYNLREISIEDIDDAMIGKVFTFLKNKNFANRTFNKYFSYYTSFLKWYAEEYNYPIRNWFKKVERKSSNSNPESITQSEYEALLKQIKPESGIKEYETGIKPERNVYRPWLADGIRLALETGRRREEIINLKWDNIQEKDGIRIIKVEDYKVNRIQKRNSDEEKKFIYIPITDSLEELLNELDFEKYENTDNFILAPEIKISRNRVMADVLSRGFSHYYNQLNTGKKLTFKCLRKTYITNLEIFMGKGNTKAITGHSDDQVIERNYIDKKEMAKAAQGFNVFSSKEGRVIDLKDFRIGTKNKTEEKNLEV
jgi:integrase